MENVSQIYGFLIKDCIDIHKDVIDFCGDIEFDVISGLPEDGTVFGFISVPLIYLRLAKSGSSHQWEATTPNQSDIFASQQGPRHSTPGSKSTLKIHKTFDTQGIKMFNAEGK